MHFERNFVFWLAALVVFVALLWLLSPILLPFVLGMAIAYVLDPLAERLSKRGMSRLIAALLILGGFVVAFAILFLLIAPVLARQFAGLIENAPSYAQRLQAFVSDPSHPWIKTPRRRQSCRRRQVGRRSAQSGGGLSDRTSRLGLGTRARR